MCPNGYPDPTHMKQLPIFVNLDGQKVVLLGNGDAADAKRRLIERAGGICVGEDEKNARIAFVALEDENAAHDAAARLKARGFLVNVVDRPALCDFTTPAIIDRDPLLVAIGTGGTSAGLAKSVRQRLEQILPPQLGQLARALFAARSILKQRFPDGADRRRAIDAALDAGGVLDAMASPSEDAIARWCADPAGVVGDRLETWVLHSNDPDDLSLRQARLLGQADTLFHDADLSAAILNRARADAVRILSAPPEMLPAGLSIYLKLQIAPSA